MAQQTTYIIYHADNQDRFEAIRNDLAQTPVRLIPVVRGTEAGRVAEQEWQNNDGPIVLLLSSSFLCSVESMHEMEELSARLEARLLPVIIEGKHSKQGIDLDLDVQRVSNLQLILSYMDFWHEEYIRYRKDRSMAALSEIDHLNHLAESARKTSTHIGAFLKFIGKLHPVSLAQFMEGFYQVLFDKLGMGYLSMTERMSGAMPSIEKPAEAEVPLQEQERILLSPETVIIESNLRQEEVEVSVDKSETSGALVEESENIIEEPVVYDEEEEDYDDDDDDDEADDDLEEDDNEAAARLLVKTYQAQDSHEPSEALQQLQEILALDPRSDFALLQLARIYKQTGENEQAASYYERTILNNPLNADAYAEFADLLARQMNEAKRAEQCYEKAIYLKEHNPDFHYQYAILLIEHFHKYKKARKHLKDAIDYAPNHPFANYDLAKLYKEHLEDGDKAKKYYEKAVAINAMLSTPENDAYFGVSRSLANVPASHPSPFTISQENYSNVTVLITGATSGIGQACAEAFASFGFRLILTGRRNKRLQELKEELEKRYQVDVLALDFDISERSDVEKEIAHLKEEWSQIDVLINNAGLAKGFEPIHEGSFDHWDEMIDTNLKGLLNITRLVVPQMVARKSGMIINIASVAGKEAYPNGNVYSATKSAVDALTKGMRLDLFKHNIRVASVSPGHVEDTEFALVRFEDEEKARIYEDFTPLNARDVAESVLFIATRPAHVSIQDVVLTSVQQAGANHINRTGRIFG